MNIGIYGGSFNPIHNGHVALAETFLTQTGLDEVWLMVSPQNPFKVDERLLDDHLRLEMVRKTIAGKPRIVASDYEFNLPKPSYTWDTLRQLSVDYPKHRFTLLIGGDNWQSFSRWYHSNDILSHYPIVVFPRKGFAIDKQELPSNVHLLRSELINISSTEIRQRVCNGMTIEGFVSPAIASDVEKYYQRS